MFNFNTNKYFWGCVWLTRTSPVQSTDVFHSSKSAAKASTLEERPCVCVGDMVGNKPGQWQQVIKVGNWETRWNRLGAFGAPKACNRCTTWDGDQGIVKQMEKTGPARPLLSASAAAVASMGCKSDPTSACQTDGTEQFWWHQQTDMISFQSPFGQNHL